MKKAASVYRMFGGSGELLYVGVTSNLNQRMAAHSQTSKWVGEVRSITVQQFDYRHFAELAEGNAIRDEEPKYNVICQKYQLVKIVKQRLSALHEKTQMPVALIKSMLPVSK